MSTTPRKAKILVVDDEEINRKLLTAMLDRFGYASETAKNGVEALEVLKTSKPDLVLLDVMMPYMNGYEVCRRLKEDPATRHIPVVIVTALDDRDARIKGIEIGASDFLAKPIDSVELLARVRNLVKVKEFGDFLLRHKEMLEQEVLVRTAETREALAKLSEAHRRLEESQRHLKESYQDTILRLTKVSEFKDEDTYVHISRVGRYCAAIAKALELPPETEELIYYAAPMHDIGKVGIPSDILLKPGKLSPEEFALMKTHTVIGGRILAGAPSDLLRMAERIALTHHERWDGSGYPRGLRGEAIPVEGRIMNLADQYDALRSVRPYKPAFDHETVVRIITEGDGRTMPSHFDPALLAVFRAAHASLAEIFASGGA
jgi:putative two-component system response regulator